MRKTATKTQDSPTKRTPVIAFECFEESDVEVVGRLVIKGGQHPAGGWVQTGCAAYPLATGRVVKGSRGMPGAWNLWHPALTLAKDGWGFSFAFRGATKYLGVLE